MKQINIASPSVSGWYALYSFLLTIGLPLILLVSLAKQRSRAGLLERLGVVSRKSYVVHSAKPVLWIHAVSMGEAMAIVPLVVRIKDVYPNARVFVSTITDTGRDVVLNNLQGLAEHLYLPFDYVTVVKRVLNRINPHVFMFVDTELWPNLLHVLQSRRIPTMLINGRLSSKSFGNYMKIRPFMKHVIKSITFCAMQSKRDLDRICALGADTERVMITGSIKCDQELPVLNPQIKKTLSTFMRMAAGEDVIVAASTHSGEETALLEGYKRLLETFPSLVLLLAPRHLDRVSEVEKLIRSHSFVPVRKTMISHVAPDHVLATREGDAEIGTWKRVLLLDTHGELATMFQFATIVWVGGSWVPVGGHNLLEPAQAGKPILFGPYMDHVSEMAEMMIASGGGIQISSLEEMVHVIAKLLQNKEQCKWMGNAASQVVKDNQGALDRTLRALHGVLNNLPCLDIKY
tara:strand:+ start:2379 stop:3761 length:1383 start_codon:yes stop_codon:yes gene_type:complete